MKTKSSVFDAASRLVIAWADTSFRIWVHPAVGCAPRPKRTRPHGHRRTPCFGRQARHGFARTLAIALVGFAFAAPIAGKAVTIWTGAMTNFTNLPGSDPTQATNQDRLTPGVWITRSTSQGIFNAKTETGFTHSLSPADTEWADGTTANYATLSYTDWDTWTKTIHTGPPSTVGLNAVVHLISEDIYLDVKFTSWGGIGGGFSWQRSTPAANQPPAVAITSPASGAFFPNAPASVTLQASASDTDGSVTNVEFFDFAASLGSVASSPYDLPATLSAGTHQLTAVAIDNLGLSNTSLPVTVTVKVANLAPSVTLTNPANNSVFGNTDRILIAADASDPDGSITNVQFFEGALLLGSAVTSPYRFTSQSFTFSLGTHALTAVAFDNLGRASTSAPVDISIERYLPALTNGSIGLFLVPVATGMAAPLYGVSPPGDTHRLFVLEQNGLVRIIQDGTLLPTPALDIQSRVSPPLNPASANDERGLLGLAFHPGFNIPSSPGYRTLYTYNSESNTPPTFPVPTGVANLYKNAVNEWKISSADPNIIDPASRREVVSFGKNAGNHNGGTIAFGPDGYMYLGLGDGGDANDVGLSHIEPGGNAQNLSTPLGKMLRIDPLSPPLNPASADPISLNGQYRVPAGNPFQGPGQVREIFAYGLRNPYRFSFDPVSGDLIQADVGQNNIEEIDRILIGRNYGWPIKEGDFLFNRTNGPAGPAGTIGAPPGNRSPGIPAELTDPISVAGRTLQYDHNEGISITGGFVYRGKLMPELYGKYIFGDLALIPRPTRINGRLFYADLQTGTINAFPLPQFGGSAVLPNGLTVHGFGQDADGELYALVTNTAPNGNGGIVYKLLPFRLVAQRSGNAVDISWPATGPSLQVQANSPGAGIGNSWITVPGSTGTNRSIVAIDPTKGSVFFRLSNP